MAMTTITIKMDENLKVQAEKLFADKGLNMETAFQSFVNQMVKEQEISDAASGEMSRDGDNLKAIEKTETVTPESYIAGSSDVSAAEMIDLGASRRYSTNLQQVGSYKAGE